VRILLVEDDDRVAAALQPALRRHGMSMLRLAAGRDVMAHLGGVDIVLLDLGLPDVDGVDVCRAIRETSDLPIIIVSARGEVDDRILGLHSGADDYLVKPYDVGELGGAGGGGVPAAPRRAARLGRPRADRGGRGVAGPGPAHRGGRRRVGDAVAQGVPGAGPAGHRGRRGVHPQPDRGRGVGPQLAGGHRTLDVHVATLRTKLRRPELVQTVRGVGYRLGLPAAGR